MTRVDFDLDSAAFEAGLAAALRRLEDGVAREVQAAGDDTAERAQAAAPVASGDLRASISVSFRHVGDVIEVEVGTDSPVGIYQEFGTSRHGPQPFMRPALASALSALRSRLGRIRA